MTQPYDNTIKYTAGVKLSKACDAATIVLLEWTGPDCNVVACETLACSENLREVSIWLDKHASGDEVTVAGGVDSSAIRYLDIRIPPVDEPQQYRLLKTQAEAVLPLSADQMALSWQVTQDDQGLLCKTAVIRKQLLPPSDRIQTISPEAVGLSAVWKRYGDAEQRHCILLHRREHDILAALLKHGHLRHSTVIDADGADLKNGSPAGLLLQDIQAELETIEADCQQKVPLFILSENPKDDFLNHLCERIQNSGWNSNVVFLKDYPKQDCGTKEAEAFGLALTAKTDKRTDFDFRQAERIEQPEQTNAKAGTQFRNMIAITIALLVLALGASYWKVKKDVKLLDEVMSAGYEDLTVQQVLKEQSYRETIARTRPDMMDLFERVQKCQKGILLDTFEFEKGKPVKITATAPSYDAAYQFQKELEVQNKNIIKTARLLDPRVDAQGKVIRFTVTFDYRNFSK